MNKKAIFAGLLGWVAAAAIAQDNITVGQPERPPTIAPGEKPRPVQTPNRDQQVTVLTIDLEFRDGKVVEAAVRSRQRVNSVAPKVFARKGGDWKVTIHGRTDHSFYVFNPGHLEAETAEGSRNPFTYVTEDGPVEWSLVVPLYRDGKSLEAHSIIVIDRRTEQEILKTEI